MPTISYYLRLSNTQKAKGRSQPSPRSPLPRPHQTPRVVPRPSLPRPSSSHRYRTRLGSASSEVRIIIEFDTLLPESLYIPCMARREPLPLVDASRTIPRPHDGDVVKVQQKHASKRTIQDLAAWMEAWNVHTQVSC